jgi:hypothetical protein
MKYKGHWVWDKNCELCEGEGKIFDGNFASFNSRSMEMSAGESYCPCECAEFVEPDPDYGRD